MIQVLKNLLVGLTGLIVVGFLVFAVSIYVETEKDVQTFNYRNSIQNAHFFKPQKYVASDKIENASFTHEIKYTATTPEEIRIKKAQQAVAQATAGKTCSSDKTICLPLVEGSFRFGDGFRTADRPDHQGLDFPASEGTKIYSVMTGTVIESTDSGDGWGVKTVVRSVVNGSEILITYAHQVLGSRAVEVGDKVLAGSFLGLVGNTGHSFGSHLHIEIRVNGNLVDPQAWLNTALK